MKLYMHKNYFAGWCLVAAKKYMGVSDVTSWITYLTGSMAKSKMRYVVSTEKLVEVSDEAPLPF